MDAATHKKGGFESTYFHPPLKKVGLPLNKGGWKGGKGGPPLKGGCRFVKYILAAYFNNKVEKTSLMSNRNFIFSSLKMKK